MSCLWACRDCKKQAGRPTIDSATERHDAVQQCLGIMMRSLRASSHSFMPSQNSLSIFKCGGANTNRRQT
eukprot:1518021-Amphidinium_carterae.1